MMHSTTILWLVLLLVFGCFSQEFALAQQQPLVVFCDQEVYALCAFANCTINADLKTASCPCFGLTGVSAARVDLIPTINASIQEETEQVCSTTSCQSPDGVNNAPLCQAIANGQLWKGADAVSTFSRALEAENGVLLNDEGEQDNATWTCAGVEGRMVPNCMLAPCRKLAEPQTNPYFAGEADYECICPLLDANVDYEIFGGLQSPCGDASDGQQAQGDFVQNTAGAVLQQFVQDQAVIDAAWAAVAMAFGDGGEDEGEDEATGDSDMETETSDAMSFSSKSKGNFIMIATAAVVGLGLKLVS